jgi:N-acetylglucosaminyl-diphospho-decaprenol L-rhamnosyltransferase
MTAGVAIIIVNFNAGEHLRRCIAALDRGLVARDWHATVIDNASSDGSADLAAGHPRVRLIRNDTNRGFGAAVNQAAAMTSAPLLLLLNPDCAIEPGALEILEKVLADRPECAVAAPQLLNTDGTVQASARGEPGAWTGLFGRHGLFTRLFPRARLARRNLPAGDLVAANVESAPVDWVMGACMLIRRDLFDLVGGFDERYFLYWEDADLCRRLRNRGYTTRYVPAARVVHAGGASARTSSALASRAFHRSAYRYYATHVVPSPWHPARWMARGALSVRAWWRVWRGR